jgi:hypothetical protein
VNPELKTIAAVADVLGARVEVVASKTSRVKRPGKNYAPRTAAA